MPDYENSEISELQQEVITLKQMVVRLAEVNSVENVLINGFAGLAAQLDPLRELAPQRKYFDNEKPEEKEAEKQLMNVHLALARPSWAGVGRLEPEPQKFIFISQSVTDPSQSIKHGSHSLYGSAES